MQIAQAPLVSPTPSAASKRSFSDLQRIKSFVFYHDATKNEPFYGVAHP